MPKLIARTRTRIPEIQKERIGRIFGFSDKKTITPPTNKKPEILMVRTPKGVTPPDFSKMRRQGATEAMVENYRRIWNNIVSNELETFKQVQDYTGLSSEAIVRMLSPEFYNVLLKTNTPIITSPLSPEKNFRSLRGLNESQFRDFVETFNPPWGGEPIAIPVTTSSVIIDNPPLGDPNNYRGIIDVQYPSSARNRLALEDIPNLVTYHGTRLPSPDHFLVPSSDADIFNQHIKLATDDGFYSSFSPTTGSGYGQHLYKTIHFGRPYLTDMYGKIPYESASFFFPQAEIERLPTEVFSHYRNMGYDKFISPLTNEVVSNESRLIKDLESNSGMFNTKLTNRFMHLGGIFNPLRHRKI